MKKILLVSLLAICVVEAEIPACMQLMSHTQSIGEPLSAIVHRSGRTCSDGIIYIDFPGSFGKSGVIYCCSLKNFTGKDMGLDALVYRELAKSGMSEAEIALKWEMTAHGNNPLMSDLAQRLQQDSSNGPLVLSTLKMFSDDMDFLSHMKEFVAPDFNYDINYEAFATKIADYTRELSNTGALFRMSLYNPRRMP